MRRKTDVHLPRFLLCMFNLAVHWMILACALWIRSEPELTYRAKNRWISTVSTLCERIYAHDDIYFSVLVDFFHYWIIIIFLRKEFFFLESAWLCLYTQRSRLPLYLLFISQLFWLQFYCCLFSAVNWLQLTSLSCYPELLSFSTSSSHAQKKTGTGVWMPAWACACLMLRNSRYFSIGVWPSVRRACVCAALAQPRISN